jgi:hypothetical protein
VDTGFGSDHGDVDLAAADEFAKQEGDRAAHTPVEEAHALQRQLDAGLAPRQGRRTLGEPGEGGEVPLLARSPKAKADSARRDTATVRCVV